MNTQIFLKTSQKRLQLLLETSNMDQKISKSSQNFFNFQISDMKSKTSERENY